MTLRATKCRESEMYTAGESREFVVETGSKICDFCIVLFYGCSLVLTK